MSEWSACYPEWQTKAEKLPNRNSLAGYPTAAVFARGSVHHFARNTGRPICLSRMIAESESHPHASKWSQPKGKREDLVIYNTFTRTKVPFKPANGNSIRWYNCGPTVYDSSHIGHARNYVTFDIIRRILEDYFNYDVTLIMNITDIDDKIILRARQEYLVANERKHNPTVTLALKESFKVSWDKFISEKFASGWEAALKQYGNVSNPEEVDAKKLMHFNTARKAFTMLDVAKEGEESGVLFDAFQDILAGELDAKYGSTVTDQKIFRDLAAYWEGEFLADMRALNVRPVSLMTRVTEFVPQVVEFVQQIIKNGYGYEAQGSVYFDVAAFSQGDTADCVKHIYAKLCPWSAGNCKFFEEGEGALGIKLGGKKDPRDFALWKASKNGEPRWDSPWGPGRPGWHIECSAMAAAVAPGTLDIHSGGIDLAFPHHDNELAQSEAFYRSSQWVNYFMHAGHVHIEGHKMSKSLKNFITIRDALERYTARQLRIMFLQHQWHAPVFYKESSMITASAVEALFSNFFGNVNVHLRGLTKDGAAPCTFSEVERQLMDLLDQIQNKVHACLCDNFDTPAVLLALQELVTRTNIYIASTSATKPLNYYVLKMIGKYVTKVLRVFGVVETAGSETIGFESASTGQSVWDLIGPILEQVSSYRDNVRSVALDKKGII